MRRGLQNNRSGGPGYELIVEESTPNPPEMAATIANGSREARIMLQAARDHTDDYKSRDFLLIPVSTVHRRRGKSFLLRGFVKLRAKPVIIKAQNPPGPTALGHRDFLAGARVGAGDVSLPLGASQLASYYN
jgi:hypothetical protein